MLDDRELALVWKAAEQIGYPFGRAVQLLILTGQRRGEVGAARWAEFDTDAKLWRLAGERCKNGRAHTVPLSPQALQLLESLPRIGASGLVFSTNGRTVISGFSKAKLNLDKRIAELNSGEPIPPWSIHDIRRSVASGMARIGAADLVVIERVLNHISGSFAGIVQTYQRYQFQPEMARALARWGEHVRALLLTRPSVMWCRSAVSS